MLNELETIHSPLLNPDPAWQGNEVRPGSPLDTRIKKALNTPTNSPNCVLASIHAEFPLPGSEMPEDFKGTHALFLKEGKLHALIWYDRKGWEVPL